jgi:hypothetical protein
MLNLHAAAATAVRTLSAVRTGVVVAVWQDGSVTAHEPNDPGRNAHGVPLFSITRASEIPTMAAVRDRLRAAATLRGLLVEDG